MCFLVHCSSFTYGLGIKVPIGPQLGLISEYGASPITGYIASEEGGNNEVEEWGSRKQIGFSMEKERVEHRAGGLYVK